MKVVFVITRSDVVGGASVHLVDLALGVRDAGHKVTVFVGGDGALLEYAEKRGLECRSLRYLVREIRPLTDLQGFFELRTAVAAQRPDIIHLHSSKAGILGRLVAKSLSIPVVFTAHGWAFTEGVSPKKRVVYRTLERWFAPLSNKIITVSDYDRQLALDSRVGNNDLLTTIHNGIPDQISESFNSFERRKDSVTLIMVARFDTPKDQVGLLKALSVIHDLDWSLELVGNGPFLEQVKSLAAEIGLSDRVVFSGACDDVAARLARADIFCLISNWEGFPLAILEAMRARLPVVASRVGGIPEAVDDGKSGFLVSRGNVNELTVALRRLIESVDLRSSMGEQGRLRYEHHFTFETMLQRTLGVYKQAVTTKSLSDHT